MFYSKRKKALLILYIALFTIVLSCAVLLGHKISDSQYSNLENFQGHTENQCITLSWNPIKSSRIDHLELTIHHNGSGQIIEVPTSQNFYKFTEGEHGDRYDFELALVDKDGVHSQNQAMSRLFLDEGSIPDLPVIRIDTLSGQLPPATFVQEAGKGATIRDNDYVDCQITVPEREGKDVRLYASVRRRGNATAFLDKFSLKIKLDEKENLLDLSKHHHKNKEWCLIPSLNLVNLEAGFFVADLCGQEWTPAYRPVNLMLNGDWMGTYYLCETVKKSTDRLDISSTGFIIQNDAYWWNAGDNYFRTPLLTKTRGYTYKYPSVSHITDEDKEQIYNYIDAFEHALYEDGNRYLDFIDLDSFVTWLLSHDILGTWDGGGSNVFLYKENMEDGDWLSTPLKIGPIWDLESCFQQTDDWANIRHMKAAHMHIFVQKEDFQQRYVEKWDKISPKLEKKVKGFLDSYSNQYGEAIQESWNLDFKRWELDPVSFDERVEEINAWMTDRVQWMNQQLHP